MVQPVLMHGGQFRWLYQNQSTENKYYLMRLAAAEKHYQPLPYQITQAMYDGGDSTRTLTGISVDYGCRRDNEILICVEVAHLHPSQIDELEIGVLIGIGENGNEQISQRYFHGQPLYTAPWQIYLLYKNETLYNNEGLKVFLLPHSNQIIFLLEKTILYTHGWKGEMDTLSIQLFTAKPGNQEIVDSFEKKELEKPDTCCQLKRTYVAPFGEFNHSFHKTIPYGRAPYSNAIYQIMTDRFHKGESAVVHNLTLGNPEHPDAFNGGNIKGITEKIEYIRNVIGASGVWISPVTRNISEFKAQSDTLYPYHYYWPDYSECIQESTTIDPRQGTLQDLKELVDVIQTKGMRLIFDVILHHSGYLSVLEQTKPDWFRNGESMYHYSEDIPWEKIWDAKLFGLPAFDHQKKEVQAFLINLVCYMLNSIHVDRFSTGLRLDALRHIPWDFCKEFCETIEREIGVLEKIGEIVSYHPEKMAEYQEKCGLMGMFDYPLYYRLIKVLNGESMKLLADYLLESEKYLNPFLLYAFVSNHDTNRIKSVLYADSMNRRVGAACIFLFTAPRNPVLYYGDEHGYEGTVTQNGFSMVRSKMQFTYPDAGFTQFYCYVSYLRNEHNVLREGGFTIRYADQTLLAYSREHPACDEEFLVIIHNQYEKKSIQFTYYGRYGNIEFVDLFTGDVFSVKDNVILVHMGHIQSRILVPLFLLNNETIIALTKWLETFWKNV